MKLAGRTVDNGGQGVEGVLVTLNATQVTLTDARGKFEFANAPGGSTNLLISKSGYSFTPTFEEILGTDDVTDLVFIGKPANYTYDPLSTHWLTRLISDVRISIPDTHIEDPADRIFDDGEILASLRREGRNPKRAAASLISSKVGDNAFVLKQMRLLGISTDGGANASVLMQRVQMLRAESLEDENLNGENSLEIIDYDTPSYYSGITDPLYPFG